MPLLPMDTMTSQILESVDFTKTKKSRYLQNKILFLQNKKINQLHFKGYFRARNSFVAEVTFKNCSIDFMI